MKIYSYAEWRHLRRLFSGVVCCMRYHLSSRQTDAQYCHKPLLPGVTASPVNSQRAVYHVVTAPLTAAVPSTAYSTRGYAMGRNVSCTAAEQHSAHLGSIEFFESSSKRFHISLAARRGQLTSLNRVGL